MNSTLQRKFFRRKVLLGVSGGIAAYRSAELVRRLREDGAEVRVVMTENAERFISSLTMQAVSGHAVRSDLFDENAEAGMGHIELARWADIILIAPATASFIAKLAHGIADDLLTTLCLATSAPVAVAPAMNQQMWSNKATQHNVNLLQDRGIPVLGPDDGDQACGEFGPGRMMQPTDLAQKLNNLFSNKLLTGLNVLITAGSTWEAIDPVRGITNRSSGKMGFAIAQAASSAGSNVTLISGPVSVRQYFPVAERIRVVSAQEMLDAVLNHVKKNHIFISVAAVSDYRPQFYRSEKFKKTTDEELTLKLSRNTDILAEAKKRHPDVFAVGFAAETSNLLAEGRRKLLAKGVNLIAANNVGGENSAIGADTNKIELIDRNGVVTLGPAPKSTVAQQLIECISDRFHAQSSLQNTR